MLRGRIEKLFVLVILLIAGLSDVTLAVITVDDSLCAAYNSPTVIAQTDIIIDPTGISSPCSASLAEIGVELLKAPSVEEAAGNLAAVAGGSSDYTVMPAVPAALMLVITGFLCVSLVKDRKNWLAACVGLVCIGQLSISALPKVASHLKNALKTSHALALVSGQDSASLHDSEFRVRSEVEGTRYIGLLRKLSGIPDDSQESTFNKQSSTDLVCDFVNSTQSDLRYEVPTFAACISNLFGFETLLSCPVRSTGHSLAFSPAFLISNLPHGPPSRIL